jgi:solute carrier family 25 (mitochondrial phosphate transporter), member 23/24/25/41
VAPLEMIHTHLMVGNSGADTMDVVFQWIMRTEGWTGLFRGNTINVLRVAPSKAIEAR